MGVDGISVLFIVLSAFLYADLHPLPAEESIHSRVKEYMVSFLILETMMIGMFSALDYVLFYVFFEGVLIPMFVIIGIWGSGPRRIYAAFKLFLFTLLGSVLMLVALLAMYVQAGTTDIPTLLATHYGYNMQVWLWLAMFASFAVKVPMWPVHTWLPDAHVEAPTAGSVILAGVLLKMGGYGFPALLDPDAAGCDGIADAAGLRPRSIVAVIYTSLVALAQGGHEEDDRLFLDRAYGLRHRRHVLADQAGHGRLDPPDAQPRRRFRRFVALRRRGLRPAAHPRDRSLRRRGEQHAEIRRVLHDHAARPRSACPAPRASSANS